MVYASWDGESRAPHPFFALVPTDCQMFSIFVVDKYPNHSSLNTMTTNKQLQFDYTEYSQIEELNAEEQRVVRASIAAQRTSHSPYSQFRVGAAVLLANGQIVEGSNQENGAYPSGLCAERVAMFAAATQQPQQPIRMLAISASHNGEAVASPVAPCGGCRQVMVEYIAKHGASFPVLMVGASRIIKIDAEALIPFSFTNADNV